MAQQDNENYGQLIVEIGSAEDDSQHLTFRDQWEIDDLDDV